MFGPNTGMRLERSEVIHLSSLSVHRAPGAPAKHRPEIGRMAVTASRSGQINLPVQRPMRRFALRCNHTFGRRHTVTVALQELRREGLTINLVEYRRKAFPRCRMRRNGGGQAMWLSDTACGLRHCGTCDFRSIAGATGRLEIDCMIC